MKVWIPITAVEQRHSWTFEVGFSESGVHPFHFIKAGQKALALGDLFSLNALKSLILPKRNKRPSVTAVLE